MTEPNLQLKETALRDILLPLKSVLVGFSGGADSAFLLSYAAETLGKENTLAATVISETYPESEIAPARDFCKKLGVPHILVSSAIPAKVSENTPDRCYFCKKDSFNKLLILAAEQKIKAVLDGTNADDTGDYRPGLRASEELGILNPLKEAGLGKAEIRRLSKMRGLSTADKPQQACLASRIPYGEKISPEKLVRIGEAENFIRSLGIRDLRVRAHDGIARIEVPHDQINILCTNRELIVKNLRQMGFIYITADLAGFRSGSMNEVL